MEEQPATLQGVTVAEAAAILGVSTTTIRRMLKRGQLEGERVHRPQGTAFVVTLPTDAAHAAEDAAPTRQVAGAPPRGNASPAGQLAAWSETFLVPLVAALERSQATVRDQAETIGELRAENRALLASTAPQSVERTTEPASVLAPHTPRETATLRAWGVDPLLPASPPSWLWTRRVLVTLALAIIAVAVVLLAWPR
jgi:excisionase family DNA binding protein